MSCLLNWLSGLSFLILSFQIYRKVLPWLYANAIGPILLGSRIKFKNYGDWALITGATEGIGKAYARQLAQNGKNVVLVSRSKEKLEVVAKEIETEFKVRTKIIDVDFSQGPEIFTKIETSIELLNVGILVNNVGVSYTNPEYFLSIPNADKLMADIVRCNIVSVTNMCKIVLPKMLTDQRGIVINISSMAATIPNPLLTVYSASKAFVDKFSEDLATEYKHQGIIVQSVLPGFVATNMTRLKRTSLMTPSADVYVAAALRTVGYSRHTTGYFPHAIMKLVIDTLQAIIPETSNRIILRQMEKIRMKALKKSKAR